MYAYNHQRRHFATLQENISSTYELGLIRKTKQAYPPDRHAHQGHAAKNKICIDRDREATASEWPPPPPPLQQYLVFI